MLANSNATANLAVKDLGKARAFYEGMLGLSQVQVSRCLQRLLLQLRGALAEAS